MTALIPAFNDAYTLSFCLDSVAPHFGEVIVLDDASVDETPAVLQRATSTWPHIRAERHDGIPLGPIAARNRLLELARGEHLFFLDADDVLIEHNASLLQEITGMAPLVGVQLAEMWGDFEHTTQRLCHYDPCHIYLNRSILDDILWGGHGNLLQRPTYRVSDDYDGAIVVRGPGPLFWHLKGVKPDWRLAGRPGVRGWLAGGRRDYYYDEVLLQDPERNHRLAMERLLTENDNRIQRYTGSPPRPVVLETAQARFQMIYENDTPVDRIDHGWWAGTASQPLVSPLFLNTNQPVRSAEFTLRRLDSKTVELTSEGQRVRLNDTAYAIWSLCDGQRTIQQIADHVSASYPEQDEAEVRDAAARTILTLYRQRIVQFLPGG